MMKINKITFAGKGKVLSPNEMKGVLGGQIAIKLCHMSSGNGFPGSGDFDYDKIVCEGECPSSEFSGANAGKRVCKVVRIPVGTPSAYMCDCVPTI